MKTLGEATLALPWIAPSVASLLTLARTPFASAWPLLRTDPGIVLLLARVSASSSCEPDISLLDFVIKQLPQSDAGFVDWHQPGADRVYQSAYRHAILAERLAAQVGCDADRAWTAGMLAPLGYLALAASQQNAKHSCEHVTAIARRLGRAWRLPTWLSAIVGQLGLHAPIAERLGADAILFQLIQLVSHLVQQRDNNIVLPIGSSLAELVSALPLSADKVDAIADDVCRAAVPVQVWESPAKHPLLVDLLGLALENRRRNDAAWIERMQQDLDRMHETLIATCKDEENRLHTMKLTSLAEFAGGAGHEINNPLAVISGQAQYVLKQMAALDGPADEIDNVGEYLDNLRMTITPSLQKIIGQTHRIHAILTELMQFARPSTPKSQAVSAMKLVSDTADALRTFARERKVELIAPESSDAWIMADPNQARIALMGLLKNAIEAAPVGGWARMHVANKQAGFLDFIVEDSGSGPSVAVREHLFDPFYSGRSAGRGRGMGLPTAWRLARQQGGDVRFDAAAQGVTRFVLTLPITTAPAHDAKPHANGATRNGSHKAIEVGV